MNYDVNAIYDIYTSIALVSIETLPTIFLQIFLSHSLLIWKYQGWMLTQKVTGPVGPVTLSTGVLVLQKFYGPYKFFFNVKEKTLHKIYQQHIFLFILSSFISKTFGTFLRGNLLTRMSPNVYWPCRTS